MDPINPEDAKRIHGYTDAELDAILDRTHKTADALERLAVLEEIHARRKLQDATHQQTQKDIKKIAAWTLTVGIVVLLITLIQLLK